MTGQELILRMAAWLRTYVVISEAQALVCALWAANTWTYQRFSATPYLEIMAETKRSGKTTLGECLGLLSQNPKMFATIRPLTIVRMIEALEGRVTVFIDEAEKLGSATLNETRTMLATGYRKGQMHAVSVGSKFQEFPTFCPKAFMLIGNVQDVIRDRCIPIYLERGRPEVMFTNYRETAEEQAGEMVAALADIRKTWRDKDMNLHIPMVDPVWLQSPRDREIWTPLFSIASALGLHKPTMELLQAASVDFSSLKTLPRREYHSAQDEAQQDDTDAAAFVLRDLQSIYREGETGLATAAVIERLRAIPTSPWRTWRGDGLNEHTLAALLSRYGIQPVQFRMPGKGRSANPVRGYRHADVMKAKP